MMPGTSTAYGGIFREKEALIDPNTPVTESIGSGPFKFNKAEWVPGAKVVYDKNTDYVPRSEPPSGIAGGKVVKLDRVEYKVIADAATAFTALGAGEVDLLDQPALDLIPTVEKNPDVVIGNITMLENYGGLRPNVLHPPFNNPKARQALALMVDQTEYAQAAYGDKKYWRTCMSMMVCGGPYGSEAGGDPYRKQDLAKARQLLKESGYNGEKIVVIGAADIASLNALTLMTIENLKKIGANVEPVIADADSPGRASVWWKWTAPGNGSTTLSTLGSNYDTTLAYKIYNFSAAAGSDTTPEYETIFSTIVDNPPPGYYRYFIQIGLASNDPDITAAQFTQGIMGLRALSAQVVKQ